MRSNSLRRISLLLFMLLALLALPATALAQPPVACGNLSDDDCAFLEESKAAMQELATHDNSASFDLSLQDIPGLPSDIAVSFTSDGSLAVNPELTARMQELQANPPSDPAAMVQEMMDAAVSFYQETTFDLTWNLEISQDIADLLSAQAGVEMPTTLELPVRMVDGYFYANLDDLSELTGLGGWFGLDMATLIADGMKQSAAQMEDGLSNLDPTTMGMLSSSAMMSPALQAAVNNNTAVERLDDDTVDGTDVAQFHWNFNLGGFLADPAVIDMFVQRIKAQIAMQAQMGDDAPPISDAEIQQITSMMPMLAPMLLGGLQFETNAQIGLEDKLVYTTETNVSWDLGSVLNMAAAMGQGVPRAAAGAAPAFTLDVRGENSNFDGDVSVEAPADAQIIPLEQLESQSTPTM